VDENSRILVAWREYDWHGGVLVRSTHAQNPYATGAGLGETLCGRTIRAHWGMSIEKVSFVRCPVCTKKIGELESYYANKG
jgi:hypothetical protein